MVERFAPIRLGLSQQDSQQPRSVCIIGCGTAGQTAAIFLARAGWRVTVLERAEALSPVGAGLLLQPTGMSVLARLGVLERVLRLGARIKSLEGHTTAGREVMRIAYADLEPGLFGLGVHRGMLFQMLQAEVERSGVRVMTGVEVVGMDPGWGERSATPRQVVDAAGQRHGPFDLVVVADGARSRLRPGCPLVTRERVYPWGAMWFVGELHDGPADVLWQVYRSTTGMVGFLPSGRRDEDSERTVSMFLSVAMTGDDGVEAVRRAGLGAFCDRVRRLTTAADSLLEQITGMEQVITASYMDVRMRRTCVGNVAVLGDAAHATSPQLGQGANLALLDAASLADCIAQESDVAAALARHDAARRGSVLFYQRASRWMTPVFQSDQTWISPARDALLGPLLHVPWVRREALRTLAGVKTGVFGTMRLPRVGGE